MATVVVDNGLVFVLDGEATVSALDAITPEMAEQFEAILESPGGLAAMLFLALLTMFFLLTFVTSAGGALAAKVLEKD